MGKRRSSVLRGGGAIAVGALLVGSTTARAEVITNGIPAGELGHLSVDVQTGGESRDATLTARRADNNELMTSEVLFDYFSYVDPGNNGDGFRLSGTTPVVTGTNEVTSTGSFAGNNNNTINWSAVSFIAEGSSIMSNLFTFTAETGTLGNLRFLQYMDEDIEGVSDDVFFTRGSIAGGDLELFTIDNDLGFGVSHSGALSEPQGLVNSIVAGWAADEFDNMRPRITGSGQDVSFAGVIQNLPTATNPFVGSVWGPRDIVSVLAWDVDPDATSATILTTLGGVPDVTDVPPDHTIIPEPASATLLCLGSLVLLRRKRLR